MNPRATHIATALTLLSVAFLFGCGDPVAPHAVEPEFHHADAHDGGNGGIHEETYTVDAVQHTCPAGPAHLLSVAPGSASDNTYQTIWPDGAIMVTPVGASLPLTGTSMSVSMKRGAIESVIFFFRDADGVLHQTDRLAVDPPVEPTPAGFRLHVDATDVDVLRKKTTQGKGRFESVGWICVSDIVYSAAE